MRFRVKGTQRIDRDWIANQIAAIYNAGGFRPYQMNAASDANWVIDSSNNAFLYFSDDDRVFEIRFRYNKGMPWADAFLAYLPVRLGLEVMSEVQH